MIRGIVTAIVLAVLALAALLAGCAGDDASSGDDEAWLAAAQQQVAPVNARLAAVAACRRDAACLARTGPALAERADAAVTGVAAAQARVGDDCLRAAGDRALDYLRGARTVGRAAARGDVGAVGGESARLRGAGGSVLDQFARCGGAADSPRFVATRALRDAFTAVGTAAGAVEDCGEARCIARAGTVLQRSADDALDGLGRLDVGPLPSCYVQAVARARRALFAYRAAGTSFAGLDAAAAQHSLQVAGRAESGVARSLARC